MHDLDRISMELRPDADSLEFEDTEIFDESSAFSYDGETAFTEQEELALVEELLSLSSEEELDQFLGNLIKKAVGGIKKAMPILKPLGGILKGVAKKALPFVGGALGTMIPVPGVGTALGTALGSAIGNALETELALAAPEEREYRAARTFVRMAQTAARRAARCPPTQNPVAAAKAAVVAAAKQHLPSTSQPQSGGYASAAQGGRWIRRGRKIIILGV